jgi:hypothetical protein
MAKTMARNGTMESMLEKESAEARVVQRSSMNLATRYLPVFQAVRWRSEMGMCLPHKKSPPWVGFFGYL